MSALAPRERERLDLFVARLLGPVPDEPHTGIAKALLATRYGYDQQTLSWLRRMVCSPSATVADYARLMALIDTVKEAVR